MWSCSLCGASPTSRGDWCDKGCGSDYNEMTEISDKCQLCDKPIAYEFKFLDGSVFRGPIRGFNYLCEDCWTLVKKDKVVRYERIQRPEMKPLDDFEEAKKKWDKFYNE